MGFKRPDNGSQPDPEQENFLALAQEHFNEKARMWLTHARNNARLTGLKLPSELDSVGDDTGPFGLSLDQAIDIVLQDAKGAPMTAAAISQRIRARRLTNYAHEMQNVRTALSENKEAFPWQKTPRTRPAEWVRPTSRKQPRGPKRSPARR